MINRCLTAVAAICLMATPAHAQNVTADLEQIASIMQKEGYRALLQGDEGSVSYIQSGTSGVNFSIFAYGCNDQGEDCKTVQFYLGIATDNPPSLEKMNEFAMKNRWGRVYLDAEQDPCIEMDIDLEDGGISEELFFDNLEYWDMVVGNFSDFVRTHEVD